MPHWRYTPPQLSGAAGDVEADSIELARRLGAMHGVMHGAMHSEHCSKARVPHRGGHSLALTLDRPSRVQPLRVLLVEMPERSAARTLDPPRAVQADVRNYEYVRRRRATSRQIPSSSSISPHATISVSAGDAATPPSPSAAAAAAAATATACSSSNSSGALGASAA